MERFFEYLPDGVTFRSRAAGAVRQVYAPLCSSDGKGIKSAITPLLSGDIKLDKFHYLTRPASREDLRQPVRNFYLDIAGAGIFVFSDPLKAEVTVEVGQLWHKVVQRCPALGVEVTARTFVPLSGGDAELTCYSVRNISDKTLQLTPTVAIPVFARALANKHDHEHVTALLNRVEQLPDGIVVEPSMMFNEEGHKACASIYFVYGAEGQGNKPVGSFPTFESFLGESGTWSRPEAVFESRSPKPLSSAERQGKEVSGALRFARQELGAGEEKHFIVGIGMAESRAAAAEVFGRFSSVDLFGKALKENEEYWTAKTAVIRFETGEKDFSSWMRWVTLQPVLRRIFGCSFLPDHDYGKGGKGWRDIWQDLLSLILIEPEPVRATLLNNFAGVRIDGTNATIIGQKPGEFIADRNAITRVWMDHGVWPFLTTQLYIDQTGDTGILFEKVPYFCDPQMARSTCRDESWTPARGERLRERQGGIYYGTVLEHILVQHLVQFFNVGEHNMIRLESADWNDGLDMAFKRGESVAFSAFYAGNLLSIAGLLEQIARRSSVGMVSLARETALLLDTLFDPLDYESPQQKKQRLFGEYFKAVQPVLSGEVMELPVADLVRDLRAKGEWLLKKIRTQENMSCKDASGEYAWFNGYYDNNGERVEGPKASGMRMTLTGQVFPLMHGVASADQARATVKAVEKFLWDSTLGGVRLNTDFGVGHYPAMGRAFGFAFGTKENGAVFSHMAVMYGYALYKCGLPREGRAVLRSLFDMSVCPGRAMIYPGIPEYFDAQGRGMYHFLTGSASWYVLTLLTMSFGVRGELGDLVLCPRLVREDFVDTQISADCQFAGRQLRVTYVNPLRLDVGEYRIERITINGQPDNFDRRGECDIRLGRDRITAGADSVEISVFLAA